MNIIIKFLLLVSENQLCLLQYSRSSFHIHLNQNIVVLFVWLDLRFTKVLHGNSLNSKSIDKLENTWAGNTEVMRTTCIARCLWKLITIQLEVCVRFQIYRIRQIANMQEHLLDFIMSSSMNAINTNNKSTPESRLWNRLKSAIKSITSFIWCVQSHWFS